MIPLRLELTNFLAYRHPAPLDFTGIHVAVLCGENPNPFNPTTTIGYSLPARGQVTLEVFNPLGSRVALLVNGEIDAGHHDVQFNAGSLASGVYFYRLQAGSYVRTRALCVVR